MNIFFYLSYLLFDFNKYFVSSIFCNENSLFFTIFRINLSNILVLFFKNSFFLENSLYDLFAVDNLFKGSVKSRFRCYYIFKNNFLGINIVLRLFLGYKDIIDTSSLKFKSSLWLEREIFDMFGIFFYKNNDMRRILTDYGFEGFPLRKDFPLLGFYELQYSEETKVIVSKMVKLTQSLRLFHFSTVWDLSKKN